MLAAAAFLVAAAPAAPINFESLLRRFAAMPGMTAKFREEKRIALLRAPLVSEGSIYFAAPDRIARHVERPRASTLVMRGQELSMWDASGVHRFDLATLPVALSFVGTLRLLLTGDLVALRALYDVEFRGGEARSWTVDLVPRAASLSGVIERIEVEGTEERLVALRVVEKGGDETVTRFSEIDPARSFTDAELERFFVARQP